MPEKPDFIAFASFLPFRYANSIDLVKICLHSFFLRISYIFVTFEFDVHFECFSRADII